MEFHFTIHTYIWELDTNFRSLWYVKIEVSLLLFLYIIYMDQWLRKRHYLEIYPFWDSKLLNGIWISIFTLISENLTQNLEDYGMWKYRCHSKFLCVESTWTNDIGNEVIKRFTHCEIVNYLMEFHYTIHSYIWKLDTKFGILRCVKIEMLLQFFLCIFSMNQLLRSQNY